MASFRDQLLDLINRHQGRTDRELTELLLGKGKPQQRANQEARLLESLGQIRRERRSDGLIGNYFHADPLTRELPTVGLDGGDADVFSEDSLKRSLKVWLENEGWSVEVAWGKARGVDIVALKGNQRRLIEVKGRGSLNAMRVNYFLAILGETLQRMSHENADYFVALPDLRQFRGLWERLPALAKSRTGINALFVAENGAVTLSD